MPPRHARHQRSHRAPPARPFPGRAGRLAVAVVVGGLALAAVGVVGVVSLRAAAPGPVAPAASAAQAAMPARGPGPEAVAVLREWDERRAAAWESGSPSALRSLYAAGAGAADVRLLRSYLDRGLLVRGLRMQVLALDVLGRQPGRWHLRVTDRVARGEVVGDGTLWPLPRDQATTREVRLARQDGAWVVVAVGG